MILVKLDQLLSETHVLKRSHQSLKSEVAENERQCREHGLRFRAENEMQSAERLLNQMLAELSPTSVSALDLRGQLQLLSAVQEKHRTIVWYLQTAKAELESLSEKLRTLRATGRNDSCALENCPLW